VLARSTFVPEPAGEDREGHGDEGVNVAVYARVSTDSQDASNQLPEIEQLVAARGWRVTHCYTETISGTARVRPQLDAMLAAAHRGEFKVLVVWALDRLSRRGIAEVSSIIAKLERAGVALVSVREPWCDSSGPVRELLVAVMSWVAAQKRARLSERTKAGLARARAEGIKLGRPNIHPGLLEVARGRVAAGESVRGVAQNAGLGPSTLRRYLNVTVGAQLRYKGGDGEASSRG